MLISIFIIQLLQQLNFYLYRQKLLAGKQEENSQIFNEAFFLPLYLPLCLWSTDTRAVFRLVLSPQPRSLHSVPQRDKSGLTGFPANESPRRTGLHSSISVKSGFYLPAFEISRSCRTASVHWVFRTVWILIWSKFRQCTTILPTARIQILFYREFFLQFIYEYLLVSIGDAVLIIGHISNLLGYCTMNISPTNSNSYVRIKSPKNPVKYLYTFIILGAHA